jgi:hypothetical protein
MGGYPGTRGVILAAAIFLGGCASLPPPAAPSSAQDLEARLQAVLAKRGHPEGLSLIDRELKARHPTPRFTPALVRALLARPAALADAASLFEQAVPATLRGFVEALVRPVPAASGTPVPLRPLIDAYVMALTAAQAALREGLGGTRLDPASVLGELEDDLPNTGAAMIAPAVDEAALARSREAFIAATARFILALREAGPRLQVPLEAQRFDSPIGTVVIGTRGKDRHAAGAALIIDPGGDDDYGRAPVSGGDVAVIVDLGGNDHYSGADLAIHALSAIIDMAGDDHYDSPGPGLGAAVAGVSLLIDLEGDDIYQAKGFGQGAALYGLGALIDLAGNDQYRIDFGGQGFGHTGGVGLLWDLAGHDRYRAAGLKDAYDRGGRISMAQGAGFGLRRAGSMLGGGIGILRDDHGDDEYAAEMFAQGAGYFFAAGLLWDRGGDDQYRAIRYAQGNGTHQAVGVLVDESGDDRYSVGFGVAQGMGLDLAVGLLVDAGGGNQFDGPLLVQGAGTANGLGVLMAAGSNQFRTTADTRGWGRADSERCLPTFGAMLYDERSATFERDGVRQAPLPPSAAWGGPGGMEPQPLQGCIKPASSPEGTSPSR